MNKTNSIPKYRSFFLPAVAACVMSASIAHAEKPKKLIDRLDSLTAAKAVPSGSTVAMACAKCQSVVVEDVDETKSFLGWFEAGKKHPCPGCGGEFVYAGVPGKLKARKHVHTCSKCGDASAYCCSTAGGKPARAAKAKAN